MDHGGDGRTRREDARTRLESGEPLLRADDLAIDWNAFARLAQQVCRIAAKHRPDEANAFAELAAQFGTPARIEQMARDYLRYTQHALRSMPQSLNLQSLFSSSTTRCIHFLPRARANGSR